MAFVISIKGDDSHDDVEKAAFERHLVEEIGRYVDRLKQERNVVVKSASIKVDAVEVDFIPKEA